MPPKSKRKRQQPKRKQQQKQSEEQKQTQTANKPTEGQEEEKKDEQKIDESEAETDMSAVKAVLAEANKSALVKADKKKMDVAMIFGTDNKTAAEGKCFCV